MLSVSLNISQRATSKQQGKPKCHMLVQFSCWSVECFEFKQLPCCVLGGRGEVVDLLAEMTIRFVTMPVLPQRLLSQGGFL